MGRIVNLLTVGKAEGLRKKTEEHTRLRGELIYASELFREARESMAPSMSDLGAEKRRAIRFLKRLVWVLGDSFEGDCHTMVPGTDPHQPNASFSETIHEFEAAVGALTGLGAGGASAAGAWALVSTFGTASTGAAIGALHGVAATNAALAWFGGGALAAGGGGMLLGTMALSAIVIVPVAIFSIRQLNKSVNAELVRVEKEITEMLSSRARLDKTAQEFRKSPTRIVAVTDSVWQCSEHLLVELARAREWLYPWPVISRLWRWILRLFTGTMLLRKESIRIEPLLASADFVRRALRQEVFDQNDRVSLVPLVYPPNPTINL